MYGKYIYIALNFMNPRKRRIIESDSESDTDNKNPPKAVCVEKLHSKQNTRELSDSVLLLKHINSTAEFKTIAATKRQEVYDACIPYFKKPNFTKLSSKDLKFVYDQIDSIYFLNYLSRIVSNEKKEVTFRVSTRMTSRAGQLLTDRRRPNLHELGISSFLLFEAFSKEATTTDEREITVNGIKCFDRLDCILRIMEHEIVHLLMCCISFTRLIPGLLDDDNQFTESYHGPFFQRVAKRLFGHTDFQHDLITRHEKAFTEVGIEVGKMVEFGYDGEKFIGKVNRVQKRVTVLVKDSSSDAIPFSDGFSYKKYYVPIKDCKVKH